MRQLVPNLCRSFTKERMKNEIAAVASGFADRLRRDKSLAVVACSELLLAQNRTLLFLRRELKGKTGFPMKTLGNDRKIKVNPHLNPPPSRGRKMKKNRGWKPLIQRN